MFASRRVVLRAALSAAGMVLVAPGAFGQTQLNGIDVSHWQGTINWTSVKNSGVAFAMCKATEGTTYTDPTFATNYAAMKSHGIVRGAYHFARPGSNATTQAIFFVNTVLPKQGDLQLVLDLEATDGQTPAQVWAWTQTFCAKVQSLTHRPPIIYTGYYFWRDNVGNPTNNLNCPLWMARYASSPLPLPAAWNQWTFWQYSSTGTTPGVSGNCDVDYFNGSSANLNNLTFPREPLLRK
jgi:lysozyme